MIFVTLLIYESPEGKMWVTHCYLNVPKKTTDNQTHDKNKKIHLVALTKLRLMSYRIPFEYIQMGYKLVAT